jgi:hypothetical protein
LISSSLEFFPHPATDNHFIVMHPMTALAAFTCIAHMLELPCSLSVSSGFHIGALTFTLPPSIVPNLQQELVPHLPYVDMMPWSSLRDRILASLPVINEQEFLSDMSQFRVWGRIPWESMS